MTPVATGNIDTPDSSFISTGFPHSMEYLWKTSPNNMGPIRGLMDEKETAIGRWSEDP